MNQYQKATKKIGDFIIGKTIGQGTFGKVKSGIHMPSGHQVAIKILQKNKIQIRDDLTRVHNQLSILYNKVDHPNIIKLLQLHESFSNIYIITEYIQGKQLYELIVEKGNLDSKQCGIYFSQLVDAVSYLHSIGICHRDIKPQNIIVNGDNLKLIDFGLSREFKDNPMLITSCGSPCYAAPEMLKGCKYDCIKSDIWAMGVTLYAMAAGHLPFEHQNTQRLYSLINIGQFEPIRQTHTHKTQLNQKLNEFNRIANYNHRSISNNSQSNTKQILTYKNSPKIKTQQQSFILSLQTSLILMNDLISKILQTQPRKRLSLSQINQNAWMKQCRSYLNKNQTQYQNDQILLHSMSKYFKKTVKQIRSILKSKQIMSICTYYYLNRRKKIYPSNYQDYQANMGNDRINTILTVKSKSKSKSRSKQKQHVFNSPKKIISSIHQNIGYSNPESGSKKANQNEPKILNYLSPNKSKLAPILPQIHTPHPKNKSLTTTCELSNKQSSILSKQILRQINNKNSCNSNYQSIPSTAISTNNIANTKAWPCSPYAHIQQQNPQVHVGPFHLCYTFSTLEQAYEYIQSQLNKHPTNTLSNNNKDIDIDSSSYTNNTNTNKSIYDNLNNQIEQQQQQQQQSQQQQQPNQQQYIYIQQQLQQKYKNERQQQYQYNNNKYYQQYQQQQYIVYNNKYVLNNNTKNKYQHIKDNTYQYKDKVTNIYTKSIKQYQKCLNTYTNTNTKDRDRDRDRDIITKIQKVQKVQKIQNRQRFRYLSKYTIQYEGIIINIKLLNHMYMYYIDLPSYFVTL